MAINGVVDLLTNGLSNKYDISQIGKLIESDERSKAEQIIEKIITKLMNGKFSKAIKFATERIEEWEDFADELPPVDNDTFIDIVSDLSDLYEYSKEYKKQLKCRDELSKDFGVDLEVFESISSALKSIVSDIKSKENKLQLWLDKNGQSIIKGQ